MPFIQHSAIIDRDKKWRRIWQTRIGGWGSFARKVAIFRMKIKLQNTCKGQFCDLLDWSCLWSQSPIGSSKITIALTNKRVTDNVYQYNYEQILTGKRYECMVKQSEEKNHRCDDRANNHADKSGPRMYEMPALYLQTPCLDRFYPF